MSECCDNWSKALQSGTDNESYGSLIWHFDDVFMIGTCLDCVRFCPWCGVSKDETKEEEEAK